MQTVEKLFANTTNRIPLSTTPSYTHSSLHSNFIPLSFSQSPLIHKTNFKTLQQTEAYLQQQLKEAKQQQNMMQQLFESISRIERGEAKLVKKLNRRCNKDIIVRFYCKEPDCQKFYSSETSLQRHAKMKHNCVKNQPPQLYRNLHPEPNLIQSDFGEGENVNEDLSGAQHQSIEQKS